MKSLAVLSGVFIAGILLVSGYVMAFRHGEAAYVAPLLLAVCAIVALPVLYWLKAARKLPRALARILFATMLAALAIVWIPLILSWQSRAEFAVPLVIFSAIWTVAALPLLRAGIRHRP